MTRDAIIERILSFTAQYHGRKPQGLIITASDYLKLREELVRSLQFIKTDVSGFNRIVIYGVPIHAVSKNGAIVDELADQVAWEESSEESK